MQELTEMLPVGMVAHGGQVAQIMAELAQRQRNLPGWEAFHYEKISDTDWQAQYFHLKQRQFGLTNRAGQPRFTR